MRTSLRRFIVIAFCGLASPANAQQAVPATTNGPATAGANTGTGTPALELGTSAYLGYGDPQLALTTAASRRTQVGADLDLKAHKAGRNSDFQLSAFSGLRGYGGTDFWSHGVDATYAVTPGSRTIVGINGAFAYTQLLYLLPNTPGSASSIGAPAHALDFGVAPRATYSQGGGAQLGYSVSTRSSLLLGYDARRTSSGSEIKTRTLAQRAQFGFENRFRQRASFRLSYAYQDMTYETGVGQVKQMQQHGLNIEFGRQWAHSATRQTDLQITGGPTAVYGNGPTRYIGTAGVLLDGRFSRSWTIVGEAGREVSFIDGIAQPFLSGVFRGRVSGRLSRSVDLTFTATSSNGSVPFNADRTTYNWRGGTARVDWALSRSLMFYGEYLYRWYTLTNLPLAAGTARTSPASARVGLSWRKGIKK